MAAEPTNGARRPLLIGGERLQRDAYPRQGPPGDRFHPQDLPGARERLGPKVSAMRAAEQELSDQLRGDRIVLEARLLPNYLAPTQHPEALRDDADLVVVGTRGARGVKETRRQITEDAPTKTLLLAATARSLTRLDELLNTDDVTAHEKVLGDLIKLDDLALPGSEQVVDIGEQLAEVDPAEELALEAVLHPAVDVDGNPSRRVADLVMRRWGEWLGQLEGEIHVRYVQRAGALTYMPIRLRRSALDEAARFNPLRLLRPAPRMRSAPLRGARRVASTAPASPADGPDSDQRIAVFDGGADTDHPLLKRFVTEIPLTTAPRTDDWVSHGTLVTSAALYGHLALGVTPPTPPAYVDHYRVLPAPAGISDEDEPYWFLEQIKPVIESGRYAIVSLSYGPEVTVDEDEVPDLFTATLDELAFQHDLTVLTAVGNTDLPIRSPLGADRVMAPADAVNGTGVGACDDPHPRAALRKAVYSCVGPGRRGLNLQPVGVSFGGTADAGFVGAEPGGGLQAHLGTSYATPSMARAVATLGAEALAPDAVIDAAVRRALLAHFAEQLDEAAVDELGHGRLPDDLRPLLSCPENSATVIVSHTIPRGDTFAYPLPYPTAGLSGNVFLRWTVSLMSPTDPTDPFEYTLAGLRCQFRPNVELFRLTGPDGITTKTLDRRVQSAEIARLTAAKWTRSANPITETPGAIRSSATAPDHAHWETLTRFQRSKRASSLHLPEVWLQCFERDRGQLVPRAKGMQVDFALVMTVETVTAQPVYEMIRNDVRFAALTPIVVAPPVRVPAAGSDSS
ncbi:MAG TPA: S8 family serine peptidase [Solirubrobacteraceae bacterium]|nr:S8 family serine peptidase [Solirubrobacteraceae bacterium]